MRFKIRTLLAITAAAALLAAFIAKPRVDAAAEVRAQQRMESEWQLRVDEPVLNSKNQPSFKHHWSTWPARKLFGEKSLTRVQKLRFASPKIKQPSLQDLSAFDFVIECEFNRMRRENIRFDQEACKHIGQLTRLQKLEIGPPVTGGLVHLKRLPLKTLRCRGPGWTQAEFDAIGSIESLEIVGLTTNKFSRENMAALAKLKNLQRLTLRTGFNGGNADGMICGLSELGQLPALRDLYLVGKFGDQEMADLAKLKLLTSIHVDGKGWPESDVQKLSQLENLKSVSFGYMNISVETYDLLVAAGIEVEHYGLTNAELSEEFFACRKIYYPIDLKKSSITASYDADSETYGINLTVKAAPKPRHEWSAIQPPRLEFGFSFEGDWRKLVGSTQSYTSDWMDVDADRGIFYDGIFKGTNNHKVKFISRDGNLFHVQWECRIGDSAEDSNAAEIDAHLPFTRIRLKSQQYKITLEEAKQIIGKQFDLNDLEAPEYYGRNNSIIFKVKETSK